MCWTGIALITNLLLTKEIRFLMREEKCLSLIYFTLKNFSIPQILANNECSQRHRCAD